MKVVLVIGLPGSGKTQWAQAEVVRRTARGERVRLLDDPTSSEEVQAWLEAARSSGCSVGYIVDQALCRTPVREQARAWLQAQGCEVEFVFFAKNVAQCLRNALARQRETGGHPGGAVQADILALACGYEPPEGAAPVWSGVPTA